MNDSRRQALLAFVGLLLIRISPVMAQTKVDKLTFDSYISTPDNMALWDGPPVKGNTGINLPATLKTFPGSSVDVLMQQCFGGGFSPTIGTSLTNYTFTSASTYNELAWNSNKNGSFTIGWNQSFPRGLGMYQNYLNAVNGAAAIDGPPAFKAVSPDPFGPTKAPDNTTLRTAPNLKIPSSHQATP